MYKDFKLDERFLFEFGLHSFFQVSFSKEFSQVLLPENLRDLADKCLQKCSQHKATPPSDPVFDDFLNTLLQYRAFFSSGDPTQE